MLDTVASLVANSIATYAFNKGLDRIFSDRKSFEDNLTKVIYETIEEFKKKYPIKDEGDRFPFYESQIIVDELLKFRFVAKGGYKIDEKKLKRELKKNPHIIPPTKEQLQKFIEIFNEKVADNKELKKLEVDENYKSQIFNNALKLTEISLKIDSLFKILEGSEGKPSKIPKEITPPVRVPKREIVGREGDLEDLRQALLKNRVTALINGMGGIGKTTLAAVYVDEYYEEYDHILWLTIEDSFEEAIKTNFSLMENLGLRDFPPSDQMEACLNRLRTLESKGPKLLVLDNAREELARYYDLLPWPPGWHLLVISRERIPRFHIIELDFLDEEEAIDLFKRHNSELARDQVRIIVNRVERHTLTVEILAKSSSRNHWDFDKILEALTLDAKANVSVLHSKKKIERIKSYLSSIFDLSNLDEREIYILKQFTALPTAFIEYDFLTSLLKVEKLEWEEDFAGYLEGLYEKGFILKEKESDRYKMHPVLSEALSLKLKVGLKDLKFLIESVTDLLDIDETKDNPVDKFQYIPFGEALLKRIPDDTSPQKALLQNNLALVYREMGDYKRARDLLKEALASDLKNFGPDHLRVAVRKSNLALVYEDLGEYERARKLLEEALASDLKNFGPDHPDVAVRKNNLALVYRDLGDYERARDLLEESLASDLKNFGPDHPDVALDKSNLATVYWALGEYKRARKLLEESLASDLENFGPDHSRVAVQKSNLGLVYRALGDYERARDLLEESLASDLKNFGPDHPDVAVRKNNLATVYWALGEYKRARKLLEESLASDLENFGPDHSRVAVRKSNLALVYEDLGDNERARKLLEEALASDLKNFGPDHPQVAVRKNNLATVYQALGDCKRARDLLKEALASDLKNFGPNHPVVAIRQFNLANVYRDLHHYEKALDLAQKAYDIWLSALGDAHPDTKGCKELLDDLAKKLSS